MNDQELPITMEDDEPVLDFDTVMDYVINILAGVGLVATVLFIAFFAGYRS